MNHGTGFLSASGLAVLVLLSAALPAVAQQPQSTAPAGSPAGQMSGQPMTNGASPATAAFMQSMQKMQQDMTSHPATGTPDQQFVTMMMPHHQGAIDMARVELQYGKDPTLRRMANSIIKSQEKEIREMKSWQAQHPVK